MKRWMKVLIGVILSVSLIGGILFNTKIPIKLNELPMYKVDLITGKPQIMICLYPDDVDKAGPCLIEYIDDAYWLRGKRCVVMEFDSRTVTLRETTDKYGRDIYLIWKEIRKEVR